MADLSAAKRVLSKSREAIMFVDLVESVRLHRRLGDSAIVRWIDLITLIRNAVLPASDGRMVKSSGDGFMAVFPTVPAAIRAAFAVQDALANANAGVAQADRFFLRTGINLDDFTDGGFDIYGPGVDMTQRVSTIALPDEILLTVEACDALTPGIDADIEDLGPKNLKHVDEMTRVFRVLPPGSHPVPSAPGSFDDLRPTLAVIPFENRGGGDDTMFVGAMLAEDISRLVSRSAGLRVTSQRSSERFADRVLDLEDIRDHLRAQYVVTGWFLPQGNDLHYSVEIVETRQGTVVWKDRFRGPLADLLSPDGDLVRPVVGEISKHIMNAELVSSKLMPLDNLENHSLLMASIGLMNRMTVRDFDQARLILEHLREKSGRHPMPLAWLARWYVLRFQQGWSPDLQADARVALDLSKRSLDGDPESSLALATHGLVNVHLTRDLSVAMDSYEKALLSNPSDAQAWLFKGVLHAFRDEGAEAKSHTTRALALSPLDPQLYFFQALVATSLLAAKEYKDALAMAQASLRTNGSHVSTMRVIAIAQQNLGQTENARLTIKNLLRTDPSLTIDAYLKRVPAGSFETGRRWAAALKEAGVPQS